MPATAPAAFRMISCEVLSHDAYGVAPRELFGKFFGVIGDTIHELLGAEWSPEIGEAWRILLGELEGVVRQKPNIGRRSDIFFGRRLTNVRLNGQARLILLSRRDAGAGRRYPGAIDYTPGSADGPALKGAAWYPCAQPPEKVDLGKITLRG